MLHPDFENRPLEDLLAAVTDAMLAESGQVDAIIGQSKLPREDIAAYIRVINRLHVALVGVQPSRRFVRRLKQDLIGAPERNVISRVRHLPPRVQIAAGLALVAGFMFLSRRRMIHEARQEGQEGIISI
ncbi:MAG: hypothetical protein K8I60_23125 [Anaerolineae bacterium]|nr:hypothetical protein [Anaerolineae bacterium]